MNKSFIPREEKYYHYIANDIFKGLTKLEMFSFYETNDPDKEYQIVFNFDYNFKYTIDDVFFKLPWSYFPSRQGLSVFYTHFIIYLVKKYGAKPEDVPKIWSILSEEVINRMYEIPVK